MLVKTRASPVLGVLPFLDLLTLAGRLSRSARGERLPGVDSGFRGALGVVVPGAFGIVTAGVVGTLEVTEADVGG